MASFGQKMDERALDLHKCKESLRKACYDTSAAIHVLQQLPAKKEGDKKAGLETMSMARTNLEALLQEEF